MRSRELCRIGSDADSVELGVILDFRLGMELGVILDFKLGTAE
jgi:hypothetical protein